MINDGNEAQSLKTLNRYCIDILNFKFVDVYVVWWYKSKEYIIIIIIINNAIFSNTIRNDFYV